jgi:hypothetical protein
VVHAAVDENYINGMEKYNEKGFMFYFQELFNFSQNNDGKRRYSHLQELDK